MKFIRVLRWLALVVLLLVVTGIAMSVRITDVIREYWLWSYPIYLFGGMTMSFAGWWLMGSESSRAGQWAERLQKPFWRYLVSRGPIRMAVVSCMVFGPFAVSVIARLFELSARRTLAMTLAANLCSTVFWVSLYIGIVRFFC